jgi:hypothetical protein
MSESGTVPTSDQKRVEEQVRHFEAHTEWRLSESAQVVIEQTILSLRTDIIGMGDLTTPSGRVYATNRAFETLPRFLEHLAKEADPLGRPGETNIGAIFVLQHVPGSWTNT